MMRIGHIREMEKQSKAQYSLPSLRAKRSDRHCDPPEAEKQS